MVGKDFLGVLVYMYIVREVCRTGMGEMGVQQKFRRWGSRFREGPIALEEGDDPWLGRSV